MSLPDLPNLDVAIVIILLCVPMFAKEIRNGIRTYRNGRDLARRINQEHEARRFLEEDWNRRHP